MTPKTSNPTAINHGKRRRHAGVTVIGAVNSTTMKNPIGDRTKNNSISSEPSNAKTTIAASIHAICALMNRIRRRVAIIGRCTALYTNLSAHFGTGRLPVYACSVLPWGHAAVGYLLYTVLCRYRTGDQPAAGPVLALALGTQFPDLIDKSLAWYLGVIPSGRSLGHSVFTAIVFLAIIQWVATRVRHRELGIAFGIGYLSHLFADSIYPLLAGEWIELQFLLWPVIPQLAVDTDKTILDVLLRSTFSPTGAFEFLLVVVTTALWVSHRTPGLWLCLRLLRSIVRRP